MFKKLQILILSVFTFVATAQQLPQNISPQQIEQFKKLPRAQQEQLAQSMGIDLKAIQGLSSPGGDVETFNNSNDLPEQAFPRTTRFDHLGNPILTDAMFDVDKDKDELSRFGYDVFANAPYTFAPDLEISIPESYIIGSGDVIKIRVFGKDGARYSSKVSREGRINVGDIGVFDVAGMSFIELKGFITSEIKERLLGAEVAVSLGQLRSIRVFVVGEAFKPGPYILNGLSSITHALFAAGGVTEIGSLRNIRLKRKGQEIAKFDAYDLLINGDSSKDELLKSGDVIVVEPIDSSVKVEGQVRRPAIYELLGEQTFEEVIAMAGGFLPSAYRAATTVERFNQKNVRTIVSLDMTKSDMLANVVQAGDHIKVQKTSKAYEDSVTLVGAVSRPGQYQWKTGQKVADLLPDIHNALLPDADLSYSIIVREKDKARTIEVLQFSLFDVVSNSQSVDNHTLQPRDKVLVFSVNEQLSKSDFNYDKLAKTLEELNTSEKDKAKEAYKDRLFWQEYGNEEAVEAIDDDIQSNIELANKTLQELTGGEIVESIDARDLHPFSRTKLLLPVIEKLKVQASAGEPVSLVEVVGEVKKPGVYPLSKNGNVKGLVIAAGGLLESAFLEKAELTRNNVDERGANKNSVYVNLREQINGRQQISLQSKDRLNIFKIPSWQENHEVELRGEFKFPGKYTFRRGETLRQLIERVGGYTDYAYLEGSVFTREKLKQMELQNLLKVADSLRMEIASKSLTQQSASIDYQQARLLLADLTKVQPVGRLVVDLPALNESTDVLLESGDVVYVPTKQNSINVMGQVQVATSHLFNQDLDVNDYLRLSGGIKQRADEDKIYVIKANGSVVVPSIGTWFNSPTKLVLEPGDTIIVPLDSEYMNDLSLWATGTQIVYQAAVAIAAISGI